MTNYILQIFAFKSKTEIDESEFKAALEALDTFVKRQPGFISRELGKDENQNWVDVFKWQNMDSANKSGKDIEDTEEFKRLFSLIDQTSLSFATSVPIMHSYQ